jgi:flagellin
MGLSIVNNVASLQAQQSLNNTNNALNTSLQRLSTGLQINTGADGPAAYVIDQQEQAQISGLNTAISNTNQAVSVVQTGEGALTEVNSLLNQIRGLALSSANTGVNNSTALQANQAEINNAIQTINSIAQTTTINGVNLLNGSSGVTATTDTNNDAGVTGITTGTGAAAGTYAFAVTTQGAGAYLTGSATNGNSLQNAGTLQLSGGGLTSPLNVSLNAGDDVNSAATEIQTALNNATSDGGGPGKFVVSVNNGAITIASNILGQTNASGTVVATSAITATASDTEIGDVTGLTTAAASAGSTLLQGTVTFTPAATAADPTPTAQTAVTVNPTAGPNGLYNQISVGGANGLSFSVNVGPNSTTGSNGIPEETASPTGGTGGTGTTTITVSDNALTFQIGANANQTASLSIGSVAANAIGTGVLGLSNPNTTSLADINVTTEAGAQDAIQVVDQAISQVSSLSGTLGAFQVNTLQANASNLQNALTNTTAANSVIADTDFSSEISNFTQLQTQLQAGATVLSNANQTPQLIDKLLGS